MRGGKIIKLQQGLKIICRKGGVTIQDACDELEMERRSFYRMVETLEDMGIPVITDRFEGDGNKVRYFVEDEYRTKVDKIPNIHVTQAEVVALHALRGNDTFYRGTKLERHLVSLFDKVGALAAPKCTKRLDRIRRLFVPASKFTKDYSGTEETFDVLVDSVLDATACHVTYVNPLKGKVSDFEIEPLHFFEREGGLYLLYRSLKHGTVWTLAVERIKKITRGKRHFIPPADFDPVAHIGSAFNISNDGGGKPMRVRARFTARQAPFIRERRWAPGQEIVEEVGGSVVISFETSGRYDVVKWILGYGAEAELLEPADLRAEIAKVHAEAADRYR